MNARRTNIQLAYMYFGIAAVLFVVSVVFIYFSGNREDSITRKAVMEECQKELSLFGFAVGPHSKLEQISVYQPELEDTQSRVKTASVAIGRCVGYRLSKFCAGKGCEKPGLQFVLTPI